MAKISAAPASWALNEMPLARLARATPAAATAAVVTAAMIAPRPMPTTISSGLCTYQAMSGPNSASRTMVTEMMSNPPVTMGLAPIHSQSLPEVKDTMANPSMNAATCSPACRGSSARNFSEYSGTYRLMMKKTWQAQAMTKQAHMNDGLRIRSYGT